MSDDTFYDDGGMDPGQGPAPGPSQPAPDAYSQLDDLGYSQEESAAVRQVLDGAISKATQPLQENLQHVTSELAEREFQEDIEDLEQAYPELQRDDVAEEVLAMGREYAEQRGDPRLATNPEVLEYLYLKSRDTRRQPPPPRTSPGRQVGNALVFDGDTPEAQDINDKIIARSGRTNIWGGSY